MITPQAAAQMGNADLDAAYAASFDNYAALVKVPGVTRQTLVGVAEDTAVLEMEILSRLGHFGAFFTGLFGSTKFPLYDARGRFHQVEVAQTAVKDSALNLASSTGSTLKPWLIGAGILALILIVIRL